MGLRIQSRFTFANIMYVLLFDVFNECSLHTVTYQKTLLHTLFCLFLKSSKAFSILIVYRSISELLQFKVPHKRCKARLFFSYAFITTKLKLAHTKTSLMLRIYIKVKLCKYMNLCFHKTSISNIFPNIT